MNRRNVTLVLLGLLLASVLLYQRSQTTQYAFRMADLKQEEERLMQKMHSLEVDIRRHSNPEVLYQYWLQNHDQYESQPPRRTFIQNRGDAQVLPTQWRASR